MTELIVITYPTVQRAAEVAATLRHLQSAHLIAMDDLVVVTRDEDGNTELHQSINQSLLGVASGAFWGALIGRLFAAPWLGAGLGAMTSIGQTVGQVGREPGLRAGVDRTHAARQLRRVRTGSPFHARQGSA